VPCNPFSSWIVAQPQIDGQLGRVENLGQEGHHGEQHAVIHCLADEARSEASGSGVEDHRRADVNAARFDLGGAITA
jgi:hypothetical protein